jgi:hypothetical protein
MIRKNGAGIEPLSFAGNKDNIFAELPAGEARRWPRGGGRGGLFFELQFHACFHFSESSTSFSSLSKCFFQFAHCDMAIDCFMGIFVAGEVIRKFV